MHPAPLLAWARVALLDSELSQTMLLLVRVMPLEFVVLEAFAQQPLKLQWVMEWVEVSLLQAAERVASVQQSVALCWQR